MNYDDWQDLMRGEENHGRKRSADGVWHEMGSSAEDAIENHLDYIVPVEIHGTRGTYNAGCRCASCRKANADYRRRYRADRGFK